VRPDFEVTERNAADIARICDRLEGIPLAIELCAAWVQALSPSQMLAQLEHGFDLLVSRRSDSQPRHRSLRAAVEHSYQLLSPELRQFFIRLAIFRGGWTLQAAEAVAQIELPLSTEASDLASMQASAEAVIIDSVSTLDYLMRLRDRSLILSEEIGPEMRYRMLDALRDFARQQRSPEIDARLSRWHAEYFLALAEQAEPHFTGPDQAVWLDRLKTEHDNFRSALSWAIAAGEAEIGLRLASTLAPFWFVRGHLAEGQEWLSRITAMPQSEADDLKRARAKALGAWGMLARNQGHLPKVTAALEEALRLWRDLNDERGIAVTLQTLATCAYSVEDWDSASRYLEESMKIMPKLDDPVLQARAYINLGNLSLARSEWQRAHSAYSEGLRRYRELGDRIGMSSALNNLGLLAIYEADLSASITLLNESLAIARELGNQSGTAVAILNLAHVNRILGCYDIARSLIYEGGTTALEAGERRLQPECLTEAGYVACAEQKYGLGAKLLSAGESLRVAMGISAGPFGKKDLEAARSLARSVLGDAAFEAAWAEGKHLSFTQAFSMAMVNENVTLSDRSA
jgi:tetratricopeptide (TPR) repeat protein